MSPVEELRRIAPPCFVDAWGAAEWQRLERQYEEPQRHYHTLHHIAALGRWWCELSREWERPDEVFAAVLFHDAVYSPLRSDNEKRSAELAFDALQGLVSLEVELVADLIRLTASHGSHAHAQTGDAAFFLDIDMSILGGDPAAYREYANGIAAEYATVPRWLFRMKRKAFLQKLLDCPRIYLTDLIEDRLGEQARSNLAWELAGFAGTKTS